MSTGNLIRAKEVLAIRLVVLWIKAVVFILIWSLGVSPSFAKPRKCLYVNKKPSAQLQEIIKNIHNLERPPIPYNDLIQKDGYFVRIVPLNAVLEKHLIIISKKTLI